MPGILDSEIMAGGDTPMSWQDGYDNGGYSGDTPTGATAAPAQTSGSGTSSFMGFGSAGVGALESGLVNAGLSAVFGPGQDNRQYNQQARLQALQIQGAEQLQDYTQAENMKTWNETNYEAQVQHLENAGLNPALLYAKGGPGGQLGGLGAGTPTGAQAPDAAAQTQAAQGMALTLGQQQLLQAEAHQAEATAQNQEAQAAKTAGADTTNTEQNTELQKSQTVLNNIAGYVAGKTTSEAITTIAAEADKAVSTARSAATAANVNEATYQTQVDQIKQNYINATLQATAITSGIQVNKEEIANLANQIVNRNRQTEINQGQLQVNQAAQQTNQQNIELQHQDRDTDLRNTLSNWSAWQSIGERELVIQSVGTILGGAKGSGIGQAQPGPIGFKP